MELSFLFLLALFAPVDRSVAPSAGLIQFIPIPNYVRTAGGATDGSLAPPLYEYIREPKAAAPPVGTGLI